MLQAMSKAFELCYPRGILQTGREVNLSYRLQRGQRPGLSLGEDTSVSFCWAKNPHVPGIRYRVPARQ